MVYGRSGQTSCTMDSVPVSVGASITKHVYVYAVVSCCEWIRKRPLQNVSPYSERFWQDRVTRACRLLQMSCMRCVLDHGKPATATSLLDLWASVEHQNEKLLHGAHRIRAVFLLISCIGCLGI